jgi:hypothetical protein
MKCKRPANGLTAPLPSPFFSKKKKSIKRAIFRATVTRGEKKQLSTDQSTNRILRGVEFFGAGRLIESESSGFGLPLDFFVSS